MVATLASADAELSAPESDDAVRAHRAGVGARARVVMGSLWGETAPVTCHSHTIYADIQLGAGALSIIFGLLLAHETGVTGGLFAAEVRWTPH